MRYVYLGDRLTDPRWVGKECDPVLRSNGERMTVIRGSRPRNQLVRFSCGTEVVVLGRRLRLIDKEVMPDQSTDESIERWRAAHALGPRTTSNDQRKAAQV